MIGTRTIVGVAAAALLVLAVSPAAWAQQGFNGSVIGNVYRDPASGCGYGFGLFRTRLPLRRLCLLRTRLLLLPRRNAQPLQRS